MHPQYKRSRGADLVSKGLQDFNKSKETLFSAGGSEFISFRPNLSGINPVGIKPKQTLIGDSKSQSSFLSRSFNKNPLL